jgi:hypothetical protein
VSRPFRVGELRRPLVVWSRASWNRENRDVVRLVEKRYEEDVDEEAGFAYRYWDLLLAVEGEQFGVRIYAGEPEIAYVAVSPRPADEQQHSNLRAVARYIEQHEGGAKLFVIGDSGGYEELEAAIARKRSRA